MTEEEWKATVPKYMLRFLLGRASERKVRLFGVACCRRVESHFALERSADAIEIAEKMADGTIEPDQYAMVRHNLIEGLAPYFNVGIPMFADMAAERVLARIEEANHGALPSLWTVYALATDAPGINGPRSADHESRSQSQLLCDIFGNPFRPVAFDPVWRTSTAVAIARAAYDSREFGNLPVLADALQHAGCENADVLDHLHGPGPHVRGCWVVDLVLGKA